MHALIIADKPRIAALIEEELELMGYSSCEIVDSQQSAIAAADVRCPDLITADDRLVEGSGIAAVAHICRSKIIPVVYILGDPDSPADLLPYAYSAEKPFTLDVLRRAVDKAVVQARDYGLAAA